MSIKSTGKTSVREVSPGTYRVSGVSARSAITGRFVTTQTATRAARTTTNGSSNTKKSPNK